jgi:very-long-chain enoyl-CoA reductase
MEIFITLNLKGKKSKDNLQSLIVPQEDTVASLTSKVISNFNLKLDASRLGLSVESSTIDSKTGKKQKTFLGNPEKSLCFYNICSGDTITVKDLGIQVGWRHVYVIEYLGPLVIISLFFFLNGGFFKSSNARSMLFIMGFFHYLKRLLESAFLHEFSRATMPLNNLFINVSYYWGLFGLFCGYNLYWNDNSGIDTHFMGPIRFVFAFLFFLAEVKNLKCHIILKDLKAANNGQKGIPFGEGFELVSCANYFWEIMSWLFFALMANHYSVWIFTVFGALTMSKWAKQRHISYLKTFGDKYPKRKIIIPYIY